jgi:hypothetical protein
MHDRDHETFARFERRFRGIEDEIPIGSFPAVVGRSRARIVGGRSLRAAAAVLVVIAVLAGSSLALRRAAPAAIVGASPTVVATTPLATAASTATPRAVTTGSLTWTVACGGASDADCDGAVGLFANNLAGSWQGVHSQSGGRLTVEPRMCPTFDGLTARQCWDVTAVLSSGPMCMVVAHGANDPRYPDYFEIGGQDGADRAMGPPKGWPMCQ